jgi:hypothetical protein
VLSALRITQNEKLFQSKQQADSNIKAALLWDMA